MKSLKLRSEIFAFMVIAAVLAPCAFEASEASLGGGELQRVQEPPDTEQASQSASSAQETGIGGESEVSGGIADETQDGGAVNGDPESVAEPS